jgi:glycosyltransferase involved in cell wall biosynthesis
MPIDSIHTISQASCRDILELKSKAKIRVIPPSVDQNNYKASSQVRYENFVLYIGRLVYYKNVEILLRALQIVLKDFQNFELIIVGEGPMKQSLKELAKNLGIEKNIVFLGSISNIQKIDLLNRCLALAFPSTFEGFGLVILESFLFKKPVLLSDINPFDEIVDDGKDGYLIPPYEHVEWANKIKHLINNIDMCRNMGLNGYNKYLTKYEYSNHIENIENLYMSLIK